MFIPELLIIAKTWKQPECPSTDEQIKKTWCIHTHNGILTIKRNEIMSFTATWMDLETIVLSEVRQESQIFYDITYMWNLK